MNSSEIHETFSFTSLYSTYTIHTLDSFMNMSYGAHKRKLQRKTFKKNVHVENRKFMMLLQ